MLVIKFFSTSRCYVISQGLEILIKTLKNTVLVKHKLEQKQGLNGVFVWRDSSQWARAF